MSMSQRKPPRPPIDPTWEERERAHRIERVRELGRTGRITPAQIARRLRMDDGQVRRILRAAGIEPREEPKWYRSGR